jgi:hypothetical protein
MKKAEKIFDLDFSLLPNLETASTWMSIDYLSPNDTSKNPMANLPQTYDRANAAVKFCWFVGATAERLCCTGDDTTKTREAFLRAALSEFTCMEETLNRDLASIGIEGGCIKISDSRNPLLHIVKQLRNTEIHLRSGAMYSDKRKTLLGNAKTGNCVRENNLEIWVMDDVTLQELCRLQVAKRYRENQKTEMISWFNESQKVWGVNDIVYRAVLSFGQDLIKRYALA